MATSEDTKIQVTQLLDTTGRMLLTGGDGFYERSLLLMCHRVQTSFLSDLWYNPVTLAAAADELETVFHLVLQARNVYINDDVTRMVCATMEALRTQQTNTITIRSPR